MINQRLFDHYGIDTQKDLGIRKSCARPFDTVLIDRKGSCYACECTSWLPQSIGNLQIQELGDIVGSTMHRHLQGSIADGTYRYCNQAQCAYLRSGRFYEATEQCVKHIRLAIDDSCNLRCPSCRRDMIFHKQGSAEGRLPLWTCSCLALWLCRYVATQLCSLCLCGYMAMWLCGYVAMWPCGYVVN